MECLFCQIANKEKTAEILYEDQRFVAFKDINPKAPLHILVIPRKHIHSVDHIEEGDMELAGQLILTAQKIARDLGAAATGYKLLFNVGRGGGQVIDHLHLHLLSTAKPR